jgi:hypothetical protein
MRILPPLTEEGKMHETKYHMDAVLGHGAGTEFGVGMAMKAFGVCQNWHLRRRYSPIPSSVITSKKSFSHVCPGHRVSIQPQHSENVIHWCR